jgi:hypothetical protein
MKLNKEEILKFYKKTPFPEISLSKNEIEILKDLLFEEIPSNLMITNTLNKKNDFFSSFIKDAALSENTNITEKYKPRSSSTFKSNSNIYKKYNNEDPQKKDNLIQRNLFPPQNKNLNQNQFQNKICKKNLFDFNEFFLCKENSISIIDSKLLEYIPLPKQINLNKDLFFLVNYSNCEKNENNKNEYINNNNKKNNDNANDNIIIKGRKFSESSDSSGKNFLKKN